ncbi:hypothetical protein WN50_00220 [Limnoraphis robusta CS-951]|uniref:Uncharacterized protein n=1 Tax=Limnoraphis robusta CS-951 TaxID=1637645 RepID=A0A0F5YMK7_9CYAN|nr:hypothetical protein WN50_00220 [Limnoraphis robusta CS-951]
MVVLIYTTIEVILFSRVSTRKSPPLIVDILLFIVLTWLGYEFFNRFLRGSSHSQISVGEKILIPTATNPS